MDRSFGRATVLLGDRNGKYPQGNSVLVRGDRRCAIIDPSLALRDRSAELAGAADLVVLSHVHEDHVAGLSLFPDAEVRAHREDLPGIQSIAGLRAIYGDILPEQAMYDWLRDSFHYAARPDALPYEDGEVFELGGTSIRVHHLPGHTRGHSALLVEPEGLLFLGDIDLTGFGPYYGDAWSSLEDFERSLEKIASIPAKVWVSFHHVGVVEDRAVFEDKLQRFAAKIREREEAIAGYLAEPRSIEDMVEHRFLYPKHAAVPFADPVERRTIEQHLVRMLASGLVRRDGDRYVAA